MSTDHSHKVRNMHTRLLACLLVWQAVALHTLALDGCHHGHATANRCLADPRHPCAWCQGEARSDACWTEKEAAAIPAGLYKCMNSSGGTVTPSKTNPPNTVIMKLTNPGSPLGKQHCFELINPGGTQSPFWASKGWKYTSPPWVNATCNRTKYNYVNREWKNLDNFTGVYQWEYGIAVAAP